MATRSPVVKALIEYNNNSLEENDENAIEFKWLDVQEEDKEDITLANFIENYKSKLMRKIKKIDCGIIPNEMKY